MRFPVRVFFRLLSSLLIFFVLLPSFTSLAHAQQPSNPNYHYITPNVETGVAPNQHTFVQSLFLETLLAIQCQLTGIDLSNPTKSCLGINVQTGKFSYAPSPNDPEKGTQIGGLLGMVNQGISAMYTPVYGSQEYFRDIASNFGIAKPTYAQAYTGFDGLSPVLQLWKTTRDISYYLLIIAFIFIGIGVMLRLKIDPRTVMTVQNQIPRVIICIILITFSYAFAGLLIDTMWAVTYMGVNKITERANPDLTGRGNHLNQIATDYILTTPFEFSHQIFVEANSPNASGLLNLSYGVGQELGRLQTNIIMNLFGITSETDCVSWDWGIDVNAAGCFQLGISWLIGLIWFIIVAIALLIALFRVWFELLKAYIMVLLYVILAPIWIVFGLLPKRPLGFEKWLRVYFANLAVFPAVVFILVGARVLHDLFGQAAQYRFVPPLIGNPATQNFGAILEFGMVLMAPQLLSLIREKLSVPPNKQVGAAMQTFNAGRAAAGAPAKQALKHWNKRDQYGNAIGPIAKYTDKATNAFSRIPVVGGLAAGHDANEWVKEHYTARGYDQAKGAYKDARKAAYGESKQKGKEFDKAHKGSVTTWARNTGYNPSAARPPMSPEDVQAHNGEGQTDTTGRAGTTTDPRAAAHQAAAAAGAAGTPGQPGATGHTAGQPGAAETPGSTSGAPMHLEITIRTEGGGTTARRMPIRQGETVQQIIDRVGVSEQAKEELRNDWQASGPGRNITDSVTDHREALGEFMSSHATKLNEDNWEEDDRGTI